MNQGIFILAALLFSSAAWAAEPVRVQLNSYSLLIRPATVRVFGIDYVNQVSSQGEFNTPNGELELNPTDVPYSHWGTFHYFDEQIFETFTFPFFVDLPGDDQNNNLTPDILEFAQGLVGRTAGEYLGPDGEGGGFTCDWNKPENSHTGNVQIRYDFGRTFNHVFEVFEYSGNWTNAVMMGDEGTVNLQLTRAGVEAETFSGALKFKLASETLTFHPTTELKTETDATFRWLNEAESDLASGKIFAFLEVFDGTPVSDPEAFNYEDFNEWQLLIIDPNDSDGDGVPDLLEGAAQPPGQPRLEIVKTESGLRLTLHGETGRTYILEDASSLPASAWEHPQSISLIATSQAIDLAAPGGPIFWRARVAP